MISFKAEWRKLSRRPAVWWLGAFIVGIVALLYVFSWIEYNSPTFHSDSGVPVALLKANLYPAHFAALIAGGIPFIGGALMLVMGALVAGSEYGWGTFKTVYTQRPGRMQVLGGQLAALSAINGIVVVALFAVAALCSFLIAGIAGAAVTWPAGIDILKAMAATALIFEVNTLFGTAMAYLLRQSALAIGLGLAYFLAIETILFRALSGFHIEWLTTVEKFFVGQNAGALAASFGSRGPNPSAALVSAEQAVFVLIAYAVAFVMVATVLVRARDVA